MQSVLKNIKFRNVAPAIFIMAICLSCVKEIPIDENYQSSQIILNGMFSPEDSVLNIYTTETKEIVGYEKSFAKVSGAEVHLYQDGNDLGTLSYDDSYEGESVNGSRYVMSNVDFSVDSKYSVKVVHPSMGTAMATTEIPASVEIKSIELKSEYIRLEEEEETMNAMVAYVTFSDPSGENNYYQVAGGYYEFAQKYEKDFNINGWDSIGYAKDSFNVYRKRFYDVYKQIDPLIVDNSDDMFGGNDNMFLIFNDDLIDGKTYTLRFVITNYWNRSQLDTAAGEYFQVHFVLRSITEDLFKYYASAESFYWNDGELFAEPVQVFSNVDNGVGILSSYIDGADDYLYGSGRRDDGTYFLNWY